MKSISAIVYTSNTGYTQRYAAMLGRAAGLPVHRLGDAALPRGTAVVYLGWLCAGGIKGLKKACRRCVRWEWPLPRRSMPPSSPGRTV